MLVVVLMVSLLALKANADHNFCGADEWTCQRYSECILDKYQCDGTYQCADGSDEYGCIISESEPCGRNGYQCGSGRCINKSFLCDGEDNCLDESDEECGSDPNQGMWEIIGGIIGGTFGFFAVMAVIFFVCYGVHRIHKRRVESIPTRVVCESAAMPGTVPAPLMMQGNKYTAGSLEPLPYHTSAESPPYPTYPGDPSPQQKTPL